MATHATNNTDVRTICIVLASESVEDDDRLRRATDERGWRSLVIREPVQAMTEVAMRESEQIARSDWGLPRSESVVMLIPEQWGSKHPQDRAHLVQAMNRYLPGVSLWSHHGDRVTPMRARKTADESTEASRPSTGATTVREVSTRSTHHHTGEVEAEATITREEMDMLLETATGGES